VVRAVVFVALLASACRFDADYGGTTYRCDDEPICPAGFTCQGGVCRAELLDAGVEPDGAPPLPVLGDIITYTFDDYQPTDVAHDRSGHRHDGTDRSMALVAGRYGQGLNLSGSPLEIPDTADLYSPGRLTIEMWLFRERAGVREALFSDYDAAEAVPDTELSLEVNEDDRLELLVAAACDSDGVVTAASERTVPTTAWTHVAAVWDGDEVRFYVNGEAAGVAPLSGGCQRTARYAIGERNSGSGELHGQVDEFKLSSVAKSPAMIAASMNWDSQAAPPMCGDLLIEDEACDGPGLCCTSCRHREEDTSCNGDLGGCAAGVCLPVGVQDRVGEGLVALYELDDMSGSAIADSSGNDLDLAIGNMTGVVWGPGSLALVGATTIASDSVTGALDACLADDAITVEAWVQAASTSREGRVFGIIGPGAVNLSLSQGNLAWMGGVSSSLAIENGHPVVDTPPNDVTTELTHLVLSRSADGWRRLYVDGALRGSNRVEGTLAWDASERITLGSDLDASDAWRGTYHLVALYCRALDETEVAQNFAAGPG
jgi:hypothetical protein